MKAEDQSAEREALPPKWLADAKRRIAAAHFAVGSDMHLLEMAVIDYEEARAALSAREAPAREQRLWLWQNFVDGRPEYWAFDNPYPCVTVWGDPLTLGEPCGYAIFKESVNGRPNRPEAEVIATVTRMHAADPAPPAAKAVEMDADKLHAAIMNLPCNAPPVFSLSAYEQSIYAIGHKDARHAAAELILAALSKQGGKHG